jgi:CRISPR/Cas system-associated exonuclease Cas4 (RecB family)
MHPHDTVQMQKHLKDMRTLLGRWQGRRARLWAFQAAHCQLAIRIERRGERGNLHVICLEPEFLHGPVRSGRVEIALTPDAEKQVEQWLQQAQEVIQQETPLVVEEPMDICRKCSYSELCWR